MQLILLPTLFCGDLLCKHILTKSGTKKSNKTFLHPDQRQVILNCRQNISISLFLLQKSLKQREIGGKDGNCINFFESANEKQGDAFFAS